MATIFELTGDEREQRITELKQKMRAAYARNKAAHAAAEEGAGHEEPVAVAVAEVEPEAVAVAAPVVETVAAPAGNGAAVAAPKPAAPKPAAPKPAAKPAKSEEAATPALTPADMTRREFMTYAWGGALAVLGIETGLLSYFFMYPRFKAGEFGGKFFLSETEIPPAEAAPVGYSSGKFWLVTTEEGNPKAIYMVCTHLGCLYKWEPSNTRFECPCHGSKFTHDGFYIEGPAPRSLDSFDLAVENGQVVVDTGKKITGNPSSESPARAAVA